MRLEDLYARYGDRVQFLNIYIREAHPVDGWWLGGGLPGFILRLTGSRAATDVVDPTTLVERQAVAARCQSALAFHIPTLVDGLDDAVGMAYAAWPTRLYLVGLDGRVAYAGGPGPFGFKPGELAEAIAGYLAAA